MNLGMVFNMGGGELAAQMGLPYTVEEVELGGELREIKKAGKEAQAIIDQYYSMVPGVKEIAQKARAIAKSRGYVKTLMGRHIRFPGGQFTHKASGLVYQGTAGDLNKSNIIRISKYLASECPDAKLLLNIHDEYSISIPFGGAEKHMKEIKALVQNRPEIRVPLRIDFSEPSSNWWDATLAPIIT
jgi:DNA polymerase-1